MLFIEDKETLKRILKKELDSYDLYYLIFSLGSRKKFDLLEFFFSELSTSEILEKIDPLIDLLISQIKRDSKKYKDFYNFLIKRGFFIFWIDYYQDPASGLSVSYEDILSGMIYNQKIAYIVSTNKTYKVPLVYFLDIYMKQDYSQVEEDLKKLISETLKNKKRNFIL